MANQKLIEKLKEAVDEGNISTAQVKLLTHQIKKPKPDLDKTLHEISPFTVKFGLVGDTHLNSKYCRLDFLHALYDWFEKEKVDFAVQSGDIQDGEWMHAEQYLHLHAHGIDEIGKHVVRNYPRRKNIITFFEKGNHDYSIFKSSGHDICRHIARYRPDLVYVKEAALTRNLKGRTLDEQIQYWRRNVSTIDEEPLTEEWWEGDIFIGRKNNCLLKIFHPGDGSTKAVSYKPQEIAEYFTSDYFMSREKPKILVIGHYHKIYETWEKNIHVLMPGTTQQQYAWSRSKKLGNVLCGQIVTANIADDGTVQKLKLEQRYIQDFGLKIA